MKNNEGKKKRKIWKEEHTIKKVEIELHDEVLVKVPVLEPQGLNQIKIVEKEDTEDMGNEGGEEVDGRGRVLKSDEVLVEVPQLEPLGPNLVNRQNERNEVGNNNKIDNELKNDEVLVGDPRLDPQGLSQVNMIATEEEEEGSLGAEKIFCTDCAYSPCLCDMVKLELKIAALTRGRKEETENEEGKKEVQNKEEEEKREEVEDQAQKEEVGTQRQGEEIKTSPPNTHPPLAPEVEEEEVKKEVNLTLLEKMSLMRRKKEVELETLSAVKKNTTPRNRRNRKKEAEEKKEEVPMQKLMRTWMKGKEDSKEEEAGKEERKGVMALREKFTKKLENRDTYDEWKKRKMEKGGQKRKADEVDRLEEKDGVMVGQQKKLLKINVHQIGFKKLNIEKINHPCSSGEGRVEDEKLVGGGTDSGRVIGDMVQRPVVRDLTSSRVNCGAAADGRQLVRGIY